MIRLKKISYEQRIVVVSLPPPKIIMNQPQTMFWTGVCTIRTQTKAKLDRWHLPNIRKRPKSTNHVDEFDLFGKPAARQSLQM